MAIPSVVLINESHAPLIQERLREVAQALQTQVVRDLKPIWGRTAHVSAVADGFEAPPGSWPIRIVDRSRELGVHLSDGEGPHAYVLATDDWTVAASHELLEMLVDPDGQRVLPGARIDLANRQVNYLVEVCDPCQVYDYTIGTVPVSDFVTPEFYEPVGGGRTKLDFLGRLSAPLDVPAGCHLSWLDPEDQHWYEKGADGEISRDAASRAMGTLRDDRDRAVAGTTGPDRHSLLAARRAMSREVAEAALEDLFTTDERMRQIIEQAQTNYGWSADETREAVREYQRHLLLRYLHPGLPIAVLNKRGDLLWHQHIIDTDKYRADCELLLGGPMGHEPFYPGEEAAQAGELMIRHTRKLYERSFGAAPPRLELTSSSPF